jgi:hypothetical protein
MLIPVGNTLSKMVHTALPLLSQLNPLDIGLKLRVLLFIKVNNLINGFWFRCYLPYFSSSGSGTPDSSKKGYTIVEYSSGQDGYG